MVSGDLIYQNWIVKRSNAGLTIRKEDLARLAEIISNIDYGTMVSEMIKKREEISIDAHIPRLLNFYRRVAGEC